MSATGATITLRVTLQAKWLVSEETRQFGGMTEEQTVANAIDRVDPSLIPFLNALGTWDTHFSRENIDQIRQDSADRLVEQQTYGSTLPEKYSIRTPECTLDLYVFRPGGIESRQPCLLWLHGGGYVVGSAKDMWFAPLLAEQTPCTVISVDYRLAPDHAAPAATQDGFAAYTWVQKNAGTLGLDVNRIAIGGISAGGGLAAGLAHYIRDQGKSAPCFQFLLCPMLDHLHDTPSGEIEDHPIWTRQNSLASWEMYLGEDPAPQIIQYASPSYARNFRDLPPAYIGVGDVDLFLDENRDYAAQLKAAGIRCEIKEFPGMFHGSEAIGYDTDIGRAMSDAHVGALKHAFSRPQLKGTNA